MAGVSHHRFLPAKRSTVVPIAISQAAFNALASTIPLGAAVFEMKLDCTGECHVPQNQAVLDHLNHLRERSETYGDVILRIAMQDQ
jgi:hypothetical protein